MVPLYASLSEELKWQQDKNLLDKMNKINEEKLAQLDATIKDATENLGESEVREAHLAKAIFYTKIADKVRSMHHRII